MVDEFKLPVNESPVYVEPAVFRRFQPNEFPVEIGSLESEDFSHLGDWYQAMRPDGYGIAYRIGVKERIIDQEGDLADLLIFFGVPLAKKGLNINDAIANVLFSQLSTVMQISVQQASYSHDNLLSTIMSPPDYMLKELHDKLSH